MIGIYNILIGLIVPILLGWIFVRKISIYISNVDIFSQIAFSFLTGIGILNLIFTLNLTLGYNFSRILAFIILGITILHTILWIRNITLINLKISFFNFIKEITQNKFILATFAVMFITIIFSANWPVRDWDSIALYDFRAKIFAEGSRIENLQSDIKDIYYYRYYFVYPYLTSIAHAWSYIFHASTPLPIYAGFYSSILLLLLSLSLHRSRLGLKSLIRTNKIVYAIPLIAALTPQILSHSGIAYTNLPYATYFLAAIFPLIVFPNNSTSYFLSLFMLVSSTLTRFTEPFYLSIIAVLVYKTIKNKQYLMTILYPTILYIVRKLWMAYVVFGDELAISAIPKVISSFNLNFFMEVETYLLKHYTVNITIPLFIMLTIVFIDWIKNRKLSIEFMIFWIINLGILFMGGYFFAVQMETWKEIGGSAERMVLAFIPMLYLWSIYFFSISKS